ERTSHFDKYQNNDTRAQPYIKEITHKSNDNDRDQPTAKWDVTREYGKGDTVLYEGTVYQLMWGNTQRGKNSPDKYIHWKPIGGKIPEWSKDRGYVEGDKVSYKGTEYQATGLIGGGKTPVEDSTGWKAIGGATSQVEDKPNSKTFTHEGATYRIKYTPTIYLKSIKQNRKDVWQPLTLSDEERAILDAKAIEGVISQATKDTPYSKTFVHEGATYKIKYNQLYLKSIKQNGKDVWQSLTLSGEERAILDAKAIEGVISQTGM
ncbi:hypothetical protein CN553_30860, partial [Bacillus cereus]